MCADVIVKRFPLIAVLVTAAILVFFFGSFKTSATSRLEIDIQHYVGANLLVLDSAQYKNGLGQTYTISKFKYYIGNIRLKKEDGSEYASNEYFLVNEDEAESKKIELKNIPEGRYKSITFMLGVDSLHNCSGAQSGALDPVNAMFWTWNTGYIFLKLEGHASASNSPGHIFEYHIGGYKQPANCIRLVTLNFGKKGFEVKGGNTAHIGLKADIARMLQSPNKIDFSKLSSVTDFHNATTVADNYVGMFTLIAE